MTSEEKIRLWSEKILPRLQIRGECLEWPGAQYPNGYGLISFAGKNLRVHRIALEASRGADLGLLMACHRCDNRLCCNPAHLFAGNHQDNMRDGVSKRRFAYGENHGRAKLTASQVRTIRLLHSLGATPTELARKFGMSRTPIRRLLKGTYWRYLK